MKIIGGILHQTCDTCKLDPDLIFHRSVTMNTFDNPLEPISRLEESRVTI